MARLRNPVPLHRRYTRDLRHRVVYQHNVLGFKTTTIAINLDMPLRVVQRTLQCWRELGDVLQTPSQMGRVSLMTEQEIQVCTHCAYLMTLILFVLQL